LDDEEDTFTSISEASNSPNLLDRRVRDTMSRCLGGGASTVPRPLELFREIQRPSKKRVNSFPKRCWPRVAGSVLESPEAPDPVALVALGVLRADSACVLCVAAPVGRLTTRVSRAAPGAFASGQQGTPRVPGVRSDGYALGQNSAEILHSSDIWSMQGFGAAAALFAAVVAWIEKTNASNIAPSSSSLDGNDQFVAPPRKE